MNLPTEQQCLELFEKYKVPSNIKEHCLNVRKVAVFLAKKLTEQGLNINVELVDRAALLHDLFKVVALKNIKPNKHHQRTFSAEEKAMWQKLRATYPNMHESQVAYLFFNDEYPDLASTIRRSGDHSVKDRTWEERLIYYIDHRILKNQLVTLSERLIYAREVYPMGDSFWDQVEKEDRLLETDIFSYLLFLPEQLAEQLQNV